MENPRVIGRLLVTLLVALAAMAIVASIYYRDWIILLHLIAAIGLFFIACVAVAMLNVLAFAPMFWLLGKLTSRTRRAKQSNRLPPSRRRRRIAR